MNNEYKLDNPAWHALNEVHSSFCIDYEAIKFYDPQYCRFGGALDPKLATAGIRSYSDLSDQLFVIGAPPLLDDTVAIENNLVCNQMVLTSPIEIAIQQDVTELKHETQRLDLFDLVSLVQPGYFTDKTADLGRYYGIYKGDQLVAASGERMQMNEFTEISAIVTHPAHTRNGYASQLIKHTTDLVFYENKIPYLHVLESNVHAIGLYERLGFETRRKISFWKLNRK